MRESRQPRKTLFQGALVFQLKDMFTCWVWTWGRLVEKTDSLHYSVSTQRFRDDVPSLACDPTFPTMKAASTPKTVVLSRNHCLIYRGEAMRHKRLPTESSLHLAEMRLYTSAAACIPWSSSFLLPVPHSTRHLHPSLLCRALTEPRFPFLGMSCDTTGRPDLRRWLS